MVWSEKELHAVLSNNPHLKVHGLKTVDKCLIKSHLNVSTEEAKLPKYRNHKVYVYEDGFADIRKDVCNHGKIVAVYDSQKEFRRHYELMALEKAGEIRDLHWQYPLEIQPAFSYQKKRVQAITYKADFFYYVRNQAQPVVEDVKGLDPKTGHHITTKDFNLKWKLLKFRYSDFDFRIY